MNRSLQILTLMLLIAFAIPGATTRADDRDDEAVDSEAFTGVRRPWRGPDNSTFGFLVFRGQEQLELLVPAEFEGRSGREDRKVFGIELFEGVRATRTESEVQLRGLSSVLDFEYKRDELEAILFESHRLRPGANACMECHGGQTAQTTVTIGRESTELNATPIRRNNGVVRLAPANETSVKYTVSHWLTPRLQLMARYRNGRVQNGTYEFAARAMTFGANVELAKALFLDISGIWSKTETYDRRRIIESHLTWRPGRRLKLTVGGGAFLDGLAHFGANMVEMGQMSMGLEKEDSRFLPALFKTLKDKQFGYLQSSLVYEYPF